jgi:stress response protein YsnF
MDENDNELVIPVVHEELHADAVPVPTGGVRVTKHTETHDEILEQELRKGRVEIKRVKTNRVVDGPQPVQRSGDTVIIPVVSEVLRVEKQWVVTEEIHLTQIEERETVQQKVPVNQEQAVIERLDESGNPIGEIDAPLETDPVSGRVRPATVVARSRERTQPSGRRSKLKSVFESRPEKK